MRGFINLTTNNSNLISPLKGGMRGLWLFYMTRTEIEKEVKNFLVEEFEIDEEKITPNATLKEDLGIDSLDFVDIVVIVDKIFGFKIKGEDMKTIKTFSDFCGYIELKMKK